MSYAIEIWGTEISRTKNQVFKIQKEVQRIICEFKHNVTSFRRLWAKYNVILTYPCCQFSSIHFQSVSLFTHKNLNCITTHKTDYAMIFREEIIYK